VAERDSDSAREKEGYKETSRIEYESLKTEKRVTVMGEKTIKEAAKGANKQRLK
jgi:hypothetical protein